MDAVKEPERVLQVVREVDVLVCGGGPAGFIAAIAAARSGARTLLIERYGFLGGMATVGLVGPISKFRCNEERVVGGIPWEFVMRMAANNGAIHDLPSGNVPFDPEIYKRVAVQMLRESGAELLLHAYAVNCIRDPAEPGKLTHAIIESKSGRQAVCARTFIDCTGDADLIHHAGFAYERGSAGSEETQPMTLYFRLGGVDTDKMDKLLMAQDQTKYTHQRIKEALQEARSKGKMPNFGGPWLVHGSTIRKGELSVNVTRYAGNAVDVNSLTEAECQSRENMFELIPFLQANMPYLIASSTQVGIRESRRIKGVYTMKKEDVLEPQRFHDTVAQGAHPIDIHSGNDHTQEVVFLKEPYQIPYRALQPIGAANILAAGRCVSATREAFGSMRVQAQCMALGEAAGTAAAMSRELGVDVGAMDGGRLRQRLQEQGAIV